MVRSLPAFYFFKIVYSDIYFLIINIFPTIFLCKVFQIFIFSVPSQPPVLAIEILLPDRVEISWPTNPEIDRPQFDRYNIYVEDLTNLNEHTIPNVPATDRISISLIPNTTYSISLSANGPQGEGPRSKTLVFATPADPGLESSTLTGLDYNGTLQSLSEFEYTERYADIETESSSLKEAEISTMFSTSIPDATTYFDNETLFQRLVATEGPELEQTIEKVDAVIEWRKIEEKCSILQQENFKIDLVIVGDSRSFQGNTIRQLYVMVLRDLARTLNSEFLVSDSIDIYVHNIVFNFFLKHIEK